MTPRVFLNLKALTYADLYGNLCVNRGYVFPEEYQELMEHLKELCSPPICTLLEKMELNVNCANSIIVRVQSGTETFPAEYPFIAALYDDSTQTFFCGGVLVTAKHVVTAAHCLHPKHGQKIHPKDIFVLVGRHNITRKAEWGSETRWVKEIFIHPEWNKTATKYDADIAILKLDDNVRFSEQIKTVCVDNYPNNTISNEGKVASSK